SFGTVRPNRAHGAGRPIAELDNVIRRVPVAVQVDILDGLLEHEGVDLRALCETVQRYRIERREAERSALSLRACCAVRTGPESVRATETRTETQQDGSNTGREPRREVEERRAAKAPRTVGVSRAGRV